MCGAARPRTSEGFGEQDKTSPYGQVSSRPFVRSWRNDMAVVYALILAVVGALFVYLALQVEGGFSLTSLNLAAYYVTVAFIAFVNMILFAAAIFAKE